MSDYTPDEATVKATWTEFFYLQSHGMKHVDDSGTEFDRFIAKIKAEALREAASEALVHDQSSWLRYVKETDRAIIEQWLVTLAERIEGAEA